MSDLQPVPDAEPADMWDSEYIKTMNDAWLEFHPGEELPEDATTVAAPGG